MGQKGKGGRVCRSKEEVKERGREGEGVREKKKG